MKITIAIDGFSSCGKSTMARALAARLGYTFIDSGAMYRAVALYLLEHGIDYHNTAEVERALSHIKIDFVFNADKGISDTYLNGRNVEDLIRGKDVANVVSKVSAISAVRRLLVHQQQEMGRAKGIVMDGRDIGTVVFPDAELKIFVTARPEVRAERRCRELAQKEGLQMPYEEVYKNLQERDFIDTTRADSPLKQADDAILLDNSDITREEQLDIVVRWAKDRIHQASS